MKILFIIITLLFISTCPLHAEFGSGGPIITMNFTNFSKLNEFLTNNGYQGIDDNMISWGGAGSGFLNKSTAIGGIFFGGSHISYAGTNQVHFIKTIGLITIEPTFINKPSISASGVLGFGLGVMNMRINGTDNGRLLFLNTALCIGPSIKIRLTDVVRIEFFGLYLYISDADWKVMSGTISPPGRMGMSGFEFGVGLRFGGSGDNNSQAYTSIPQ